MTKTINQDKDELTFAHSFLEEFYNQLNLAVQKHNIQIDSRTSNDWVENYVFSKENEFAAFSIWYNKKHKFTKFLEKPKECTSMQLVQEIKQILTSELG